MRSFAHMILEKIQYSMEHHGLDTFDVRTSPEGSTTISGKVFIRTNTDFVHVACTPYSFYENVFHLGLNITGQDFPPFSPTSGIHPNLWEFEYDSNDIEGFFALLKEEISKNFPPVY